MSAANHLQTLTGTKVNPAEPFRRLAESLPQLVWTALASGQLDYANPSWQQFIGWGCAADQDECWQQVVYPADLSACWDAWQAALAAEEALTFEARLRRHDGEYQPFGLELKPIFDADEQVVCWAGVATALAPPRSTAAAFAEAAERHCQLSRNQEVLESLIAFVGVVAIDGTLLQANRAPLPCSEGEVIFELGRQLWNYPWWNYAAEVQQQLRESIELAARGQVVRCDMPIASEGADSNWLDFQIAPWRDESGQVTKLICSAVDISDRKRTERMLRASEERFRHLSEAMPQLVWTTTNDGVVTYYNSRVSCYAGIQQDEHGVWTWQPVIHPDELDVTLEAWQQALETGEPYQCEHRVRLADGSYRWHLSRALRSHGEDGVRWLGTATDIHEMKQTAAALIDRTTRFRIMGEAIDYGVWLCDREGRPEYVSQSFLDLLNMTLEEARAGDWTRRLIPSDVPGMLAEWDECRRNGEPWEREHRVIARDGTMRTVLTRGRPVVNEQGEITSWVGINLDITDREALAEELRQVAAQLAEANRRKDDFLATLSHELRNPLAPIKSAVQLLQLKTDISAEVRELSEVIDRQVMQMVRLIDDLLDVSRISRGKLTLQTEPCDLREVLERAVEAARPFITNSNQVLHFSNSEQSLVVDGDAVRLVQVVVNLLNNAAKYTPAAGAIWLSAGRDDQVAWIEVRDNGIGLKGGELTKVFDMFAQVDGAKERGLAGLGIGLSLVKTLVELHQGQVIASSNGENQGCTFSIRLPLLDDVSAVWEPAATAEKLAESTRSFRVLVVEDVRAIRTMMVRLLERLGHTVAEAEHGESGLQVLDAFQPEVIFSDISMPTLDGHEFARRIRAREDYRRVPLYALTGYGQETDRQNAIESGFDGHFVKPVDIKGLAELFKQLGNREV